MSLKIVPLGGCGEIGLNATLFIDGEDALLVDCGILLGVPNAPGVERAVPGFEALRVPGRRLHGVVITHGHEDHIGALPALLADFDVPVFGTPLATTLVRSRLEGTRGGNFPIAREAKKQAKRLQAVPLGGRAELGPFKVELIRVTHSLPESAALCIEAPSGRVVHSGDFKLDKNPHDGALTDTDRLRALGDLGVDLLLADSTNSEVPGHNRCERDVGLEIDRLIGEAKSRVIIAVLASHLHRVEAIMHASRKHGRRVALVGRALYELVKIGIETGHLDIDESLLVTEDRIAYVPKRELVILTTGSQGETQAGLSRIASARDDQLRPEPDDRVIISARTIPGNEQAVRRVVNAFARRGVTVLTDRMLPVHCSGHASAEEQAELMRLVRPKNFVPVHGERAMLEAHAKTARREGVGQIFVIENGESLVLEGGTVMRGERELVSRRAIDGEGRALDWGDVKDRIRLSKNGLVVCSFAVDGRSGRIIDRPMLTARGMTLTPGLSSALEDAVAGAVADEVSFRGMDREGRAKSAIRNVLRNEGLSTAEVSIHALILGQ
jgi:ribonuclease J